MPLDNAEQLFCQLALKNKLIAQDALDTVIAEIDVSGASLPEELLSRNLIKPQYVEQIIKAIENHGESFTKSGSIKVKEEAESVPEVVPEPKVEPVKEVEKIEEVPEVVQETKPNKPKPAKPAPVVEEEDSGESMHTKIEGPGLITAPKANPKGLGKKLIEYLQHATKQDASDFHVAANTPPFIRRYGLINKLSDTALTPEQSKEMLFGVLNDDQQGKLKKDLGLDFCLIAPDDSRYRANICHGSNGWTGTFRIINPEPPCFEDLNMPNTVKRLTEYHQGLVLVTGSKGCGKTTTLASMVDLINKSRSDHIITVEDPIEYIHHSKKCQITQRALGVNTMSYANALRGALREDPDIIMVGELRDLDTISASISAAETGHLVLSSLHTTSAVRTVDRIIDAFPAKQQGQVRAMIAESIRGVVCQQLLPRADGTGMVMALEVLLNSISVRKNIMEAKTFQLDNIMQTSVREGMVRMDDSIYELWQKGLITEEVAKEFAREPDKLGKGIG